MVVHQIQNLHLPMIFGLARDLRRQGRKRGLGLGQLDYGQSLVRSQDDWWQRYVYDTTQGALRVIGARYGEGEFFPVDDPRFRPQPQPPNIDLTFRPTSTGPAPRPKEEGIRLTTNQIVLGVAAVLLFLQGKRGR